MRVGTQGPFRPYLKTFVAPFLPTRLTAPGSPRMGVFKTTSPLQNINDSCNELRVSYVHHEYSWIQFDFSIDEGASVSILCFYKDVAFFLEQAKYSYFLSILG